MTAEYAITVRAPDGSESDPLEGWTRLELVLRHNRPGSWILQGLPVARRSILAPGNGIVVRRDGTVLLSGPVTGLRRVKAKKEDTLEIHGPDDLVDLWDRLAHPAPTTGDYSLDAYDVRAGAAETVIKEYVEVNAGPTALSPRRTAGLTVAVDQARGTDVIGRARNQVLGDLAVELALAGGDLGLQVVQADDGSGRVFDVYEPEDLTSTALFGIERTNVERFEYDLELGDGNFLIVAGGGEEELRVFVEGGDAASVVRWGRRVERFVDQRQTTDVDELTQKRDEELLARGDQEKAKLEVVDTQGLGFGSGYGLGDRVTVLIDGEHVQQVMREVEIVVERKGETVKPIVASPGASALGTGLGRLFDRTRRVERRVSNVERI